MNGNGKWQLAFWIITVICGAWLLFLTTNVIANDRIRATEDQRIEKLIHESVKGIEESMQSIAGDVREIKTRLNLIES
jgi:hypothetical protein